MNPKMMPNPAKTKTTGKGLPIVVSGARSLRPTVVSVVTPNYKASTMLHPSTVV